ncbi:class I SAM-dependent methyltransferase [Hymenobacter sp. UV11]|uniref:O-methyltransferase n=1 Tax=Hymenobacter sp. UV11 TaxID=1849735 RepID=UPI00105C01FD|nr:class I SAM-dependent methyltransferase [Hymenobacter sp. UV11]TDN37524.1 SAM-dependent methyltransferase [Hymenobacter sp. UV11]TFZ68719.1 class I SAM-dependent methyltransferase [Hymenobacter sp. UV11]
MYQLLAYLRHWLLRSGNAHGLHSPFVFGLYTTVIRHDGEFRAYPLVEKRRQELLASDQVLDVTDFGAGSQVAGAGGRRRAVRDIARHAAKSPRLAQLLFRLVNHFQPATILELGTSLGLTTAYLALADSRSQVLTFEGCPNTAAVARQTFEQLKITNVQLVEGNLDATLPATLADLDKPLDFVFFDGNHRYEPTLRYFEACLAKAHEHSVFVLDDIHWSAEMEQAWAAIKAHSAVTITVDLFYVGLVFFRKKQPRQDFWLRY